MPTRTLTIKEDAYRALKARKRPGESFTDVILRLTWSAGSARRLLDMMDDTRPDLADSIETESKKFRKNFRTRNVRI